MRKGLVLTAQSAPQAVLGAEHTHLTLLLPIYDMRKLRLRGEELILDRSLYLFQLSSLI